MGLDEHRLVLPIEGLEEDAIEHLQPRVSFVKRSCVISIVLLVEPLPLGSSKPQTRTATKLHQGRRFRGVTAGSAKSVPNGNSTGGPLIQYTEFIRRNGAQGRN